MRGDFNVIVTDWSSSSPNFQYARSRVGTTGIAVSKFIEWLGVNYNTLHLVGYGLGAHVAGIAGKNTVRGRINRIIGLDPAKPLFNENASGYRLSAGDAVLVEVFHSNGGQLGIFTPIGDVDYYINNGRSQPECSGKGNVFKKSTWCQKHFRKHQWMLSLSFNNHFPTTAQLTKQLRHRAMRKYWRGRHRMLIGSNWNFIRRIIADWNLSN